MQVIWFQFRFLHIVLYSAERAWSYAMEKRQLPDGPNARQRIYLIGRLRKAVKWAALFSQLCTAKADSRTSLEAEVCLLVIVSINLSVDYSCFLISTFHGVMIYLLKYFIMLLRLFFSHLHCFPVHIIRADQFSISNVFFFFTSSIQPLLHPPPPKKKMFIG